MKCPITITYDYEDDSVAIKTSKEFAALPAIHRADALKDALHDLTLLYDATVEEMGKGAA